MKLYEVPRNTRVRIVDPEEEHPPEVDFVHVDGMYSYCLLPGTQNVVHLPAWTDVEIVRQDGN